MHAAEDQLVRAGVDFEGLHRSSRRSRSEALPKRDGSATRPDQPRRLSGRPRFGWEGASSSMVGRG